MADQTRCWRLARVHPTAVGFFHVADVSFVFQISCCGDPNFIHIETAGPETNKPAEARFVCQQFFFFCWSVLTFGVESKTPLAL